MAKDKKGVSPRTSVDTLNETLTSVEQKVENNKKIITGSVIAVIIVAAAILAYVYGVKVPNTENANNAIAKADTELIVNANDSTALVLFEQVANEYSNAAANRASVSAAALLYKQGKYEEAIKYLEQYDTKEAIVGAASQSLMADCYVNLQKYEEALKSFDEAISLSGENPLYTPIFMLKKANVLCELKKFNEAVVLYENIKTLYPKFGESYGVEVEKYLERAKVQAGAEK